MKGSLYPYQIRFLFDLNCQIPVEIHASVQIYDMIYNLNFI